MLVSGALQSWEQVPGAGFVPPFRLSGIDEFQRRVAFWNQNYRDCQIKTIIVSWLPFPATLSYGSAIAQAFQSPRINSPFLGKVLWLHLSALCSVAASEVLNRGTKIGAMTLCP